MVALTNSSNPFIPQSHSNTPKAKPLSNKISNANLFVKRMEKSSGIPVFDKSYKIELSSDKLPKTFSTLHQGAPGKKETEKTGITIIEKKEEGNAEKLKIKISNSTINSAMKLYTILKADILIENHHNFKTGPVDFYV